MPYLLEDARAEMSEQQIEELYRALGVKNQKHALEAINGLQQRVRFTESFEEVRERAERIGWQLSDLERAYERAAKAEAERDIARHALAREISPDLSHEDGNTESIKLGPR